MKRTGDPLKNVSTNKTSADATKVNVNAPKAPINVRAKMSDIPNRFLEKQNEQVRMMTERGYEPIYKTDAQGNRTLEGYTPKGKSYAIEQRDINKKYDEYKKPGKVIRNDSGVKIVTK